MFEAELWFHCQTSIALLCTYIMWVSSNEFIWRSISYALIRHPACFYHHLRPTSSHLRWFLIWTTIAIIVKLRYIASNYEYRLIYIFTVRGFQCNLNIKILINYLFSLSKDQLYNFFLFSKLLMRIFNFQLGKGGCQLHWARDNDLVNMKSCILIFSWLSLVLLSLSNKLARFPLRQI